MPPQITEPEYFAIAAGRPAKDPRVSKPTPISNAVSMAYLMRGASIQVLSASAPMAAGLLTSATSV